MLSTFLLCDNSVHVFNYDIIFLSKIHLTEIFFLSFYNCFKYLIHHQRAKLIILEIVKKLGSKLLKDRNCYYNNVDYFDTRR